MNDDVTLKDRWRRWLCRWNGHTFALPNADNYSGSLLHFLMGATCKRCGRSYEDLHNAGELQR